MARMSAERRRDAIVDAALSVARRKGLAATTVRDVAAEMGSSSGLIHHYFETMDDVVAAAFERVAGRDLDETEAQLQEAGDPTGVVRAFLSSYAPVGEDWAFQLWLDAWAEAARRPALREVSSRLNLAWAAMLERAIRDGVASGAFRAPDPAGAAWRILSVARRKGLAATTVRDVAAEMGSSSGLIHHYFETMDDVVAAAFERIAGQDLVETEEQLRDAGDPTGIVRAFLSSYAPVGEDWAFQLWLDAWAEAARRPALREASGRLNLAWAGLVEKAIRDGVAAGEFHCDDPNGAAWRILSIIDGLALQVVAHRSIVNRADMLNWAATAAERELGLAAGTLAVSTAPPPRAVA